MYPLLPWKLIGMGLTAVVAIAVAADDLRRMTGIWLPDGIIVRYLPLILLFLFAGFFGPTGYMAPWRVLWRKCPKLNDWFPDLNGIWIGRTSSNWPTIEKVLKAAQTLESISEQEIHDTPNEYKAIAMHIENSIFKIKIRAEMSSSSNYSYSITEKPWKDQHTGQIHLTYVYKQHTPEYAISDEEFHLGAADLILTTEAYNKAEGTYWTRRNWKTGRNTAGTLEIEFLSPKIDKSITLRQYAINHSL